MLRRILLTTDAVGGVWRYSMELARGFAAHGIETVLAVLGPDPDPAQRQEAASIPGLRLMATRLKLDWMAQAPEELEASAKDLALIANQAGADTVQLHAAGLYGRPLWSVPVMVVVHSCVGTWWQAVHGGQVPSDLAWKADATAHGLRQANAVVAPTASFRDALRNCYDLSCKIDIVMNGRTPVDGAAERGEHALTVGRLWDDGKNVGVLDAAAKSLRWPVLAVGPVAGPNGTRFACHYLRIVGELDEAAVARQYRLASVFVSVALYEPFGLAVLEAAQAGCALVLSDIPTFRELWDGAAVFVPAKQPERIAAVLDALLRDPHQQVGMAQRARARAAKFSAVRMADETLAVHRKMVSRRQAAA